MSNKKIYKGLNKRRRFDFRKFITLALCIALIFGYTYNKIKTSEILKKVNIFSSIASIGERLYFWKDLDLSANNIKSSKTKENDESSDDMKTLSNKQTLNENQKNENLSNDELENSEIALVDGLDVYLIQVGSFDNQSDVKDIQEELSINKIPSGVLEVDNFKKVQAYVSFKDELLRTKLSSVKKLFYDAFLTKIEIPVLSLEYTEDYSYVKNIADNLNNLLDSYRQESTYYTEKVDNFKYSDYKNLLNSRKTILDNLNKELKKIDYSQLNMFKSSLLSYTSQINNNVDLALKSIEENNYSESESLLIVSIQKYYEFINTIKNA